MFTNHSLSEQTQKNWLTDIIVIFSAFLTSVSGVYFLFFHEGGRSARLSTQNITILTRQTWDFLHTWGGVIMIAAILVHFTFHWDWVVNTTKRMFRLLDKRCNECIGTYARLNIALDGIVGVSFLIAATSGIYFLFFPGGHSTVSTTILFDRTTWDHIHTLSGVIMIIASLIHITIHWKWLTKVTRLILSGFQGNKQPTPNAL